VEKISRRAGLAATAIGVGAFLARTEASSQPAAVSPSIDPVDFWSDAGLELVALDHSVSAADGRAFGPCATARALGVVHAAIADAAVPAYQAKYRPRFKTHPGVIGNKEAFVGGAAEAILSHIFSSPAHLAVIGNRRERFFQLLQTVDFQSWQDGRQFGSAPEFKSLWNWDEIKSRIIPTLSDYIPKPRQHSIDPFNSDQGFYGQKWGDERPLVLNDVEVTSLGPLPPPKEIEKEYIDDLTEVRTHGAYKDTSSLTEEMQIGLFWAYDGARLIGTPPRLYNQILRQIANSDKLTIPERARMLALCNIAMADAGIVCWKAKYAHCVWRPVLGIQNRLDERESVVDWRPLGAPRTNPSDADSPIIAQALLGAGTAGLAASDLKIMSLFASQVVPHKSGSFTPNFPAYPSGHATFGSACFNVLKQFRAERQPGKDSNDIGTAGEFVSDELNGLAIDPVTRRLRPRLPRKYTSIDQMILDNDRSRVYLGVHWNFDAKQGDASGKKIADTIFRNIYRPT
jgi:hypothetical protein